MSESPTFDDRRASPQPCACGRLTTRPDLCEVAGLCLLDRLAAQRAQQPGEWSDEMNSLVAKIQSMTREEQRLADRLRAVRVALSAIHSALGIKAPTYYESLNDAPYVSIKDCVVAVVTARGPVGVDTVWPEVASMRGESYATTRGQVYASLQTCAQKGLIAKVPNTRRPLLFELAQQPGRTA